MQEECFFFCPHCLQRVSTVVEVTMAEQEFIEDCEVCCNPLLLRIHIDAHRAVTCEAQPAQ